EIENDKLAELESKIAEYGGEELKELSEKIIKLREELVKVTEGVKYCKDAIEKLKEEKSLVAYEIGANDKEIAKLEKEKRRLEKELEGSRRQAQELEEDYKKTQELIAKSDSTTRAIQEELVELKKEYENVQEVLKKSRAAREICSDVIERLSSECAQHKENISIYELELRNNSELIKELRKELRGYERSEQELNTKFSELTERADKLYGELKVLEPKIVKLQNYYSQLKAELSAEEAIHKGYTTAVTAILEARDRGELKGIHGTVGELGSTSKEYEQALAIAAGGRLQSIVVDNDENATKAINYLKSKKLGRATFLPLNKLLKGNPAGKALLVVKDANAVGFAVDLLKFDEKYRNAFWYVFGSTIVMKDMESARRHMGGVRLVTLTNELLEPGGAITGGSLEKTVKFGAGETDYDKVGKELREKLQQQEKLSSELSYVKAELNSIENELKSIANKRELSIGKLSILGTKSKEYSVKLSGLKNLESKLLEKLNNEKNKLAEIADSITADKRRVLELERKKDELAKALFSATPQQLATKSKELQEIRENLSEQLRALEANIQTIGTQLALMQQRKQELETRLENINKEETEKSAKIEFLTKEANRYNDELNAILKVEQSRSAELKELNEKREIINKRIIELTKDIENCNNEINTCKDLYSSCELRLPGIEEKLADVIVELHSYEPYIKGKENEKIPSVEELKTRIQECEDRMRILEPVNMKALEEYEGESKRKENIESEIKQLIAQKEELIKVMEELNAKKNINFMKVFEGVNKNFKAIYKELSGGNEGELVIENQDNIFEGGLSISVKQKGKKRKLSSLSGAEKSLTALAFIFAIQNYSPSPFYVLDEIDMHLDAFNSELVANLIKNNSKKAQFIIISLRKILLKEADHLYGVVKADGEISKIIGNVNLEAVGEDGTISKDIAYGEA
ncbi:MAG: AAA family ATPase, partial [Candidatus Thermoplasmatota archaeon]|nr:AAA family ATPase [Candidatus Thermoplasmatota archaeon]